jgi:hypothetical protein
LFNANLKGTWPEIVLGSSLIAAIILYLSAPFLSTHLFSEPRVGEALIIIAFAIPFSALASIYQNILINSIYSIAKLRRDKLLYKSSFVPKSHGVRDRNK